MLSQPIKKDEWKKILNQAIHNQLEEQWKEDITNKSSLKYLNYMKVKVGIVHHLYSTVRNNKTDIQRAELKARFLTGTYTLQGNRAAFNQFKVDPTCKICKQEPESREHVISVCSTYHDKRSSFKTNVTSLLPEIQSKLAHIFTDNDLFTHFVLDCSHQSVLNVIGTPFSETVISEIELSSRIFIHQIHLKRMKLLNTMN